MFDAWRAPADRAATRRKNEVIKMKLEPTRTVADYVVNFPPSKRVFEKLGIDYCCGGKKQIAEACSDTGVEFETLNELFEKEANRPQNTESGTAELDFNAMSLAALSDHIVRCHHDFTREEDARIAALLDKVCGVHGRNHPELLQVREVFSRLKSELEAHMLKEERMLFPYISLMESAYGFGLPCPPAPFGSTRNPVAVMISDHDAAAEMLKEIRELTDDLTLPGDACMSYRSLFSALGGLDKDIRQHIHLENNILFPKAIAMEDAGVPEGVQEMQEAACGCGHSHGHGHAHGHAHAHGHGGGGCGCGSGHGHGVVTISETDPGPAVQASGHACGCGGHH